MDGEQEFFFNCPYCFSRISMLLEAYYDKQEYIEDCEVCCRPISLSYSVAEGEIMTLNAERLDD